MDFDLTDDQRAMRETAERFAAERLAPGYKERERTGQIDRALMAELGGLGLLCPEVPVEFGGAGLDSVSAGLITEALCGADMNIGYLQVLGALASIILTEYGARELAEEVVPQVCAGQRLVALGLTEPGGGSDAANLQLKATKVDGGWKLNGEKTSISMAGHADDVVLFARTGAADSRAKGVSTFLVGLNQPGVTRTTFDDLGSNSIGRGSLFFDDVVVPDRQLIGELDQGFRQVMQGFDYSRALIGLQVIAPAAVSLAEAWQYVTERQAFGGPIARFQGVTEPLAEAETWLEGVRLLCYKALWKRDQGLPHTKEAAMVKWWAPKVAFDVLHRCILTFGHFGYSKDMPHQQRLREVLGLQIGDGTAQVQKMIIAREMIGRVALPY
jgi:cyclohexanecarboxyl-CoA dehydrogenase